MSFGFGKYVDPEEENVESQEDEDLDRDMEEVEGLRSIEIDGGDGMVS